MTVSSSTISQSPRVKSNRDRSAGVRRPTDRAAPAPVSRKNTGAQTWVTQRVRNSATVVAVRLVGSTASDPR